MKTYVHTLIKNEEKWIWYSISSVIDHVDKILLWDTGSSDNTKEIIKELQAKYPKKILFREVGEVDPKKFSEMRQEMLNESDCDWIIILDGDEIWDEISIKRLINEIDSNGSDVIIAPFINLVGDIYHFQDESAGRYRIDGKVGNYTVKAFRKNINELRVSNNYGSEGYKDSTNKFLQESDLVKRKFIDKSFLHATHLVRSGMDHGTMGRKDKVKYEIGKSFPRDYYYPEVFFRQRPKIVTSPWKVMSFYFKFFSFFVSFPRTIKRKLWSGKIAD
jgi:glycosyltransferase involved in cell wall biosynthesis